MLKELIAAHYSKGMVVFEDPRACIESQSNWFKNISFMSRVLTYCTYVLITLRK